MERYFNTEGCCRPSEHYMVKLTNRLEQIKQRYVIKFIKIIIMH